MVDISGVTKDHGLKLSFTSEISVPPSFGLSGDVAPVEFNGIIKKTRGGYALDGEMKAVLNAECALCLKEISETVVSEVSEIFSESPPEPGGWLISEGRADVGEVLRSYLVTMIPQKMVCSSDCLGLCHMCGKNLNDGPCGCETEISDDRFDILNKWRCSDGSDLPER